MLLRRECGASENHGRPDCSVCESRNRLSSAIPLVFHTATRTTVLASLRRWPWTPPTRSGRHRQDNAEISPQDSGCRSQPLVTSDIHLPPVGFLVPDVLDRHGRNSQMRSDANYKFIGRVPAQCLRCIERHELEARCMVADARNSKGSPILIAHLGDVASSHSSTCNRHSTVNSSIAGRKAPTFAPNSSETQRHIMFEATDEGSDETRSSNSNISQVR